MTFEAELPEKCALNVGNFIAGNNQRCLAERKSWTVTPGCEIRYPVMS
jgi:hypothetical protein